MATQNLRILNKNVLQYGNIASAPIFLTKMII